MQFAVGCVQWRELVGKMCMLVGGLLTLMFGIIVLSVDINDEVAPPPTTSAV